MAGRSLVLFVLNEIEGLRALFPSLPFSAADEVFAVDGGSQDGSREFLAEHGIPVYVQTVPGRGEAFRMAVRIAKGDYLVFFSPDGNEDPADIPRLFQKLEAGSDIVIASRFLPGSRNEEDDLLFPWRAWANRFFTWISNLLWNRGPYITDTINGFRGVKKSSFLELALDAPGFVIEYQMSIRAMKRGLRVEEIPTREGDRIGGESTAGSLSTGLRCLTYLLREIWLGRRFPKGVE